MSYSFCRFCYMELCRKNRAYVSPTPFLDSLRSESLVTTKLYSYAPYTDAATRSLFTGRNCLDDYGYFFRTNTSPINHYKAFHDLGYETYDFNYPSTLLVTSKTRTLIIVAIIVVSIFQVNGEEYISTILKYLGRGNCPILSIACWKTSVPYV